MSSTEQAYSLSLKLEEGAPFPPWCEDSDEKANWQEYVSGTLPSQMLSDLTDRRAKNESPRRAHYFVQGLKYMAVVALVTIIYARFVGPLYAYASLNPVTAAADALSLQHDCALVKNLYAAERARRPLSFIEHYPALLSSAEDSVLHPPRVRRGDDEEELPAPQQLKRGDDDEELLTPQQLKRGGDEEELPAPQQLKRGDDEEELPAPQQLKKAPFNLGSIVKITNGVRND